MAGQVEAGFEGNDEINEDDRINELPDDLLCSIISFLPVQQAVATSAVSRRWRDLWRYLTRLEFGAACSMAEPWMNLGNRNPFRSYLDNVEKVIRSQQNSLISSCRVVIAGNFYRMRGFDEEKRLIEFLKNHKRLEQLAVIHRDKELNPDWPPGFFNGSNLKVLELGHQPTKIQDASPFEGCKNLETLNLNSVMLSDKTLVDIIKNCTALEDLALIRCKGLEDVGIRHQRLKHLHIDDLHLKSFKLDSESMRILSLESFWCSTNDISCPHLDKLRTNQNSSEILARLSGLVGSEDRINMLCTFGTLHVTLDLESWYDLISLRFVFRAWNNIQQLCITNKACCKEYDHHSLPYPQMKFWAGESTDSIVQRLRYVLIRGFGGREREMSFVSHLIENAEGLQKLLVQFDNATETPVEEKAKKELLSLSRASTNAFIVFSDVNEKKRKSAM